MQVCIISSLKLSYAIIALLKVYGNLRMLLLNVKNKGYNEGQIVTSFFLLKKEILA